MLLLSLIGEQPIPNLLPLWQFPEYTETQFAATRTTLSVAFNLKNAIEQDQQLKRVTVLDDLLLEAYDIGQIRARLAAVLSEHLLKGVELHLNLTGGTKIMSLAALQAAFGSGVKLVYVSTEENSMIFLASDGAEISRTPIQVKISVDQYLAAHGLEVSEHQSFNPPKTLYSAPPPKEGDDLEVLVFQQAKESNLFDDVRRKVFIRKQTERGPVLNELDVVVTRNGRLAVCSCKTGGKCNRESIYELASLSRRETAGIYCGKLLVTDRTELTLPLRDRARSMNVRLVYGAEVANVAEHLRLATQ